MKKENQLYLFIDPALLKIIIDNIISNSIKFTGKGSIDFKANLKKLGNENYELIIKISDTGVGIEKEKLNSIFDKYYQVDDLFIKRFSGLGLGLYNAKKICDYLGSDLIIESEENKGTQVTLSFPLMKSELTETKKFDLKDKISTQNYKFIITFEDENILDSIKIICKKVKSNFEIIKNLNELEKILEKSDFYVVLINLDLIEENQIQVIEKIKYKMPDKNKRVIFIALYSFPFNDKKIKEFSQFIDFTIIRPFDIEDFLSKIEKY